MNRFLLGGCLTVMLGCGARTDYFTDFDGAGASPGVAGAAPAGGALNFAGAPQLAGAPGVGAGPSVGGAPGVGAGPNVSGAPGVGAGPSVGGAPGVGAGPSVGGAIGVGAGPSVGGAIGVGAGPSVAGAPAGGGSGASPGVIEACQVIAGNSCQQCLCTSCSSQIVQCFSNLGCAVILACAQEKNCQGADCYTGKNCRGIINQFGGLGGKAMADVLSLLTCSVGSQNTCSCN
jgi:hypothetical protein